MEYGEHDLYANAPSASGQRGVSCRLKRALVLRRSRQHGQGKSIAVHHIAWESYLGRLRPVTGSYPLCKITRAQFHRAGEQRKVMLSKEKSCLAKMGYQPNCHIMILLLAGSQLNFALVYKFAKQYFVLSNSVKLEPGISYKHALLTPFTFKCKW